MKQFLTIVVLFCCSSSNGQTVQEILSGLGLNFPKGLYNDLYDLPYGYHLQRIGHKINFDTLIITQAENKNFHDRQTDKPVLETFETQIYYTDKKTRSIIEYILLTNRYSIYRKYIDQHIVSVSQYNSDTLYSLRLYKYKANGELDSLIEKGTNFYNARKNDSTHLKEYVNPSKIKEYKKNGLLWKVVNETWSKYHIFSYKRNTLYQIITFDRDTNEKENIMTFNQQGLLILNVNDIERTENKYTFDAKGRWIKCTKFINGKLYEATTRKYISK